MMRSFEARWLHRVHPLMINDLQEHTHTQKKKLDFMQNKHETLNKFVSVC